MPTAVSASTFDEVEGQPPNAIDGNLATRWSGHGPGAFLTLDYGASKPFRQVQLAFYQGNARVYSFEIMYSTDGVNYVTAGTFTSSGTSNALQTFTINATGRYLRYVGFGNTVNNWNSVTEMQGVFPAVTGGTTQVDDDFEAASLSAVWDPSGNDTAALVTSEARAGAKSLQLKVGPTDADHRRTELTRNDGSGNFNTGNTYCISFSVKVKNWTTIPPWAAILQTHAVPSNWDFESGRNSITLSMETNSTLAVRVIKTQNTQWPGSASALGQFGASIPAGFGTWHDYVMRFRPSFSSDGIIETWVDGTKIYTQLNSPNMDIEDESGADQQPLDYLKIGVYKDSADTGSQEVYYDNFKIVRNPTTCQGS